MSQESANETNAFDLSIFKRNYILYLVALLQGLALLAIYKALDYEVWPYGDTISTSVLLSVLIPIPLLALLTATKANWRRVSRYLLGSIVVFSAMGAYTGYQMGPHGIVQMGTTAFIYAVTLFLLSFKAVMYMQQRADSEEMNYATLFKYSWRNSLTVVLAAVFTGVLWGILILWARLFKVLEIDLFYEIFTNEWFYIPARVCLFGVAITIVRDLKLLLDNSARIPQVLIKFLLPVLIIVSVTFLATIPFRGLSLLWKTGVGTALVLWLQALTLFFVNSVYRDEPDVRPYPLPLHRMIYCGIALLPIYSAITFCGLYLRVEQYGLTVSRSWGFVALFFLACFSIGYLYGIIKQRDQWVTALGKINIRMGLAVLVTMILVNSPILDFRKISAASQFNRLERGEVDMADFDLRYVKNELGRAGYQKVQTLKEEVKKSDPLMFAALDELYIDEKLRAKDLIKDEFAKQIMVWPENTFISQEIFDSAFKQITSTTNTVDAHNDYFLFAVDLNRDNKKEYIFIASHRDNNYRTAWLFQGFKNGNQEWRQVTVHQDSSDLLYAVENNNVNSVESEWMILKIGDVVIHVH